MIEADKMSYEDLIKLYSDKCKYCDTLEERLQKANKDNDKLTERIDYVLKKSKNVKDSYVKLYEFAEGLCDVINKKDEQIKQLIDVNDELIKINKEMGKAVQKDIGLMKRSIEIISFT